MISTNPTIILTAVIIVIILIIFAISSVQKPPNQEHIHDEQYNTILIQEMGDKYSLHKDKFVQLLSDIKYKLHESKSLLHEDIPEKIEEEMKDARVNLRTWMNTQSNFLDDGLHRVDHELDTLCAERSDLETNMLSIQKMQRASRTDEDQPAITEVSVTQSLNDLINDIDLMCRTISEPWVVIHGRINMDSLKMVIRYFTGLRIKQQQGVDFYYETGIDVEGDNAICHEAMNLPRKKTPLAGSTHHFRRQMYDQEQTAMNDSSSTKTQSAMRDPTANKINSVME